MEKAIKNFYRDLKIKEISSCWPQSPFSHTQFKARLHVWYKVGRKNGKFVLLRGEEEGITKDRVNDKSQLRLHQMSACFV